MYFSRITLGTFVLVSLASAAPVKRNFSTSVVDVFKGVANKGARFPGVAGTIQQGLEKSQLTVSVVLGRLSMTAGWLNETVNQLDQIGAQANVTGNGGVAALVPVAHVGVGFAIGGISNVGAELFSGRKPLAADQKYVTEWIKAVRDTVNRMDAAITNVNATLSNQIANAKEAVTKAQQWDLSVLSAQGLTLTNLGLPADFAQ